VFIALPLYNSGPTFWKSDSNLPHDFHAVSIEGYDSNGFFFRNSWGPDWGNREEGYSKIEEREKGEFTGGECRGMLAKKAWKDFASDFSLFISYTDTRKGPALYPACQEGALLKEEEEEEESGIQCNAFIQ